MTLEPPFDVDAAASMLRALANPMRLAVALRLLQGSCTVATLETELGLRQPNLSQQLAELRDAGVVSAERQSRNMIYSLADDRQRRLVQALLLAFGAQTASQASVQRPVSRPQQQAAVFARIGTG
ncbi:helix-turn-helix transcriptional regulator [Lichenicola cladoniae]|uniref:Helix-turn-helix transcriptional regulator n=1 Tax=Lichenicola cladoniae TaxID=1484109 RepID=A0A6M8HPU3_9PROT|nr:metalloregulator ArsR/SmtB family transcription factor [Lichenicola cladoniae]NPD66387.1 helix-turn-helix transcriptional regulator [Acetobacteraceae bacterium]QKE90372.1 helix-turn-helix transcriptional regulator [Lichenicola cladoniae]